jgi:very-short-patch-repair endonuclease
VKIIKVLNRFVFANFSKNVETGNFLPYDFMILFHEVYKIIIEIDGRHHFLQVGNWTTPEFNFRRDLYKQQQANKNGYSTIRLLQSVIWEQHVRKTGECFDWWNELMATIEVIKLAGISTVTNTYLLDNNTNEYKHFRAAAVQEIAVAAEINATANAEII